VSASVNLPLHHKVQRFSSGTLSPGWSWKKGRKTVLVWWWRYESTCTSNTTKVTDGWQLSSQEQKVMNKIRNKSQLAQ